jgi:hypothetical protein
MNRYSVVFLTDLDIKLLVIQSGGQKYSNKHRWNLVEKNVKIFRKHHTSY